MSLDDVIEQLNTSLESGCGEIESADPEEPDQDAQTPTREVDDDDCYNPDLDSVGSDPEYPDEVFSDSPDVDMPSSRTEMEDMPSEPSDSEDSQSEESSDKDSCDEDLPRKRAT